MIFKHPSFDLGSGTSDQIDANSVESRIAQPKVWSEFLDKINPFQGWGESSKTKKLWLIVKSPVVIILTLTIPVVDEEADQQGTIHILQMSTKNQKHIRGTSIIKSLVLLDWKPPII